MVDDSEAVRNKIGKRIMEARKRSGVTQLEVEDDIGLHANTLRRYEQGETDIPLPRLVRLAEYLSVPLASFLQDLSSDQEIALRKTQADPPSLPWLRETLTPEGTEVVIDIGGLAKKNAKLVVST